MTYQMATAKKTTTQTATNVAPVTTANTASKKAVKPTVAPATKKPEMVKLGNSTYHFVRNWLKPLFKEAQIEIKWLKDTDAYTGVIKCHKADVARAKKAYQDYVKKEQCVEMITF